MKTVSIYCPEVRAYALKHKVSELQAWRALRIRAELLDKMERKRRTMRPADTFPKPLVIRPRKRTWLEKLFGVGPDWNDY